LSYYPRLRKVPIIMMTGHDFRDEEMLVRRYGIRKCLRKPLSLVDVVAEIESMSVSQKVFKTTIHRERGVKGGPSNVSQKREKEPFAKESRET
jgi:DNA-binding response OmpR family regulator